jgi:hypothetical protein
MRRAGLLSVMTLVGAILSGCADVRPEVLIDNRYDYNMAVAETDSEELLLNIVRLHYSDRLYFTSVERIAVSHEYSRGINASGAISSSGYAPAYPLNGGVFVGDILSRALSLGPASLSASDKPTIFYVPLDGEKFVRQMMTPMHPDVLMLLIRSGWPIDLVFAVAVAEMNDLQNAPTAAGLTPSTAPEFRPFQEVVRLLSALQRGNKLQINHAKGSQSIELTLTRNSAFTPEGLRVKELLGLDPNAEQFALATNDGGAKRDNHTLSISTRPLMAAISYLSQGVISPDDDYQRGFLRRTTTDGSAPFDWQLLLGGIMQIKSADSRQDNAAVQISYRNHWFYIPDDDVTSKCTFLLLTQLIALHSTPSPSTPAMSFGF